MIVAQCRGNCRMGNIASVDIKSIFLIYIFLTPVEKIDTFLYSAVEWRAMSYIDLNKEQSDKVLEILSALEELDDVQNIFTNANLEKIQI